MLLVELRVLLLSIRRKAPIFCFLILCLYAYKYAPEN